MGSSGRLSSHLPHTSSSTILFLGLQPPHHQYLPSSFICLAVYFLSLPKAEKAALQWKSVPYSLYPVNATFYAKGVFADVTKLRVWTWGGHPECLLAITSSLREEPEVV